MRRAAAPAAGVAVLLLFAVAPAQAADPGWPRQFDSASGAFTIFEPQPEDLDGDKLSARAAFSLQKSPDAEPVFGVLWLTERVEIDRDSSTVVERDLDVTKVRLPNITPDEASRYEALVESEATRWDLSGSVEELRAGLAAAEKERASVEGLNHDPPRIRFVEQRAILVVFDGAPALEPIVGSGFEYVSNTPDAIVFDPGIHRYYLNGANLWYAAKDPLGPWSEIGDPPTAVRNLVPPDTSAADQIEGPAPRVYTATEPTELIASDGPLRYAPLVGDELLIATNTENDVVRDITGQQVYVLLSGRWYAARSTSGPWRFVRPDALPAAFARIPPDSPYGHLLASVSGTDLADDAVADAEIPQTSAVRSDAHDFTADYDGAPDYQPIAGTSLRYAVNTDDEIIEADGRYYACDQGVWYVADSPDGPWQVSETRPLGIDDIPPSCPVYDVRYVFIYGVAPGVVYVGYLPGYLGCYPCYGTVVYGTGWRYRPWRGRHHFHPRCHTWGFQARYNPWLTRWSFGSSYGAGFLRAGTRWQPRHEQPSRPIRPLWFGPGGFRRPLYGRDFAPLRLPRRTVRPGVTDVLPANLYNRTGNVVRVDRTALRQPMRARLPFVAAPSRPNNVFAGKDGKVYRRDPGGAWRVNEGSVWRPTPAPVTPASPNANGPARPVWPGFGLPRRTPSPGVPPQRQPVPMPVQPSGEPVRRPGRAPSPQPIPPTPGNLEREFHARERAQSPPPSPRPAAPAPAPVRPAPPRDKPAPKEREHPRDKGDDRPGRTP